MAGERTSQNAPPASESRSGSTLAGRPLPVPGRPLTVAGWSAITLSIGLLLWAAADTDRWQTAFEFTGQKNDYYNLLVDGFLDGHLHMKVAPDASGQLPYLLDASLHDGKYYMYFGVVPALLTFLPYSWLTGHDLPQNAATFLLVLGGFLFALRVYALARRRYFPSAGSVMDAGCILLLGLASGTPILAFDAGFYEVALAGGYLCFAATMLGLYQAVQGGPRASLWLAWASLAGGLAVGCRPTYLVALPVLLGPAALRIWQSRRPHPERPVGEASVLRLFCAAVGPAALVGVGLMLYNYGRFGHPLEFGFKYQVNELMRAGLPFARSEFMWPNLKWYYLTPPVLSPFFPYVLPIDATDRPAAYYGYELIHGQWLLLLPALLCTALTGWLVFRRARFPAPLLAFGALVALAFAALFTALLTFGFRANRYVVDFQPTLVLLLALAGGTLGAHCALFSRRVASAFIWSFVGLAVVNSSFNFLVGIQWMEHLANTRPRTFQAGAAYGNLPAHWLARVGLLQYGPYRFRAKLTPSPKLVEVPLWGIGATGYADMLYADLHPDGSVEFILANDRDRVRTAPMRLDYTAEHEFEFGVGSLYPPVDHPYFRNWNTPDAQRIKSTAYVRMDGEELIHTMFIARGATPFPLSSHGPSADRVHLSSISHRPLAAPVAPKEYHEFGLWQLEAILPPAGTVSAQPLLGSGISGQGNLLFIRCSDRPEYRLALDEWGHGLTQSAPFPLDAAAPHRIEIFVGPQVTRQNLPPDWPISAADLAPLASRLQVWIDGHLVWETTVHGNLDSYDVVSVGRNPQGFSTAIPLFTGTIRQAVLSPAARLELLQRALAAPRSETATQD